MNEAETRAELIDPLLTAAGWGGVVEGSRIRREFLITPGRLEGGGRRGRSLTADYVISYRNILLAVPELMGWVQDQALHKRRHQSRWARTVGVARLAQDAQHGVLGQEAGGPA